MDKPSNNGSVENRFHQREFSKSGKAKDDVDPMNSDESKRESNPKSESNPSGLNNPKDDVGQLHLDSTTEAGVRLLAQATGDHLHEAESIAAKNVRSKQGGSRSQLEKQRENLRGEAAEQRRVIANADRVLAHEEQTIVVGKHPMGLLGTILMAIMLLGLIGILWVENGAAANLLMGLGAFQIQNVWAARALMATPLGPAIALRFGCQLLSIRIRRWVWLIACLLLVISFASWATAFGVQVAQLTQASESGFFESISKEHPMASGTPAIVMFASLVVLLSTTCFVGHCGLDALLRRYEIMDDNPRFLTAFHERQGATYELRTIEERLAQCERQIATLEDEEKQAVCRARTLYKFLKYGAHSTIVGVMVLLAGCSSDPAGNTTANGLLEQHQTSAEPVHRLYAIASSQEEAVQEEIFGQLELDLTWLASSAPSGSTLYVVDAWSGAEIARFVAVDGVKRIRRESMKEPAKQVFRFLTQAPGPNGTGCVRIPRLAQLVAQLDPAPSQICVLGNPIYVVDEATPSDIYYSMHDGRIGSDGMLFENPSLSPFSIVGRAEKLNNQYWHLGWNSRKCFTDETHRHGVIRFWHLYLAEQGAKLVTAQDSMAAAMQSTRNALTKPLMNDVADRSQPAAMVRIVKIVNEAQVETQQLEFIERPGEVKLKQIHHQHGTRREESGATDQATYQRAVPKNDVDPNVEAFANDDSRDRSNDAFVGEVHFTEVGSPEQSLREKPRRVLMIRFLLDEQAESSPLSLVLQNAGFEVEILRYPLLPGEAEFARLLDGVSQVWIWSSPNPDRLPGSYLKEICRRFDSGDLHLYLLTDNNPYIAEANLILHELVPGARIGGNYRGELTLVAKTGDSTSGFDVSSPIFAGVEKLFEGTTISRVELMGGLRPICFSSDGAILMATLESNRGASLIVDGGFTRFYKRYWNKNSDSEKLAINIAEFLSTNSRRDDVVQDESRMVTVR